jgi:dihydrofolate reductase
MRKVIAGMNMTLDGVCDHTAMIADDEIHEHYNELLRNADTLVYGRVTYQLMESYWPLVVKNPTGNKAEDDFAILIDNLNKLVFSRTLQEVTWRNSRLATKSVEEEVMALKEKPGKDILVGSPSLIVECANLGLVDEFQISVQSTIEGKGLRLFKNIKKRIDLKLINTKTFGCGAVTFYYEPRKV